MSDYSAETNKLGNAVGIPFAANQTGSGMLDLAFSADDLSRMNAMFWLDGIKTDSGDLESGNGSVEWVNGMNVVVRPFRAHLNGTIVFSEQVSLEVKREDTADRIDSVIVRRDYLERTVDVMVLKGVPGSGQPPVLGYNDGGIADLELARITVRPGMEALSQPDITDVRRPIRPHPGNSWDFLPARVPFPFWGTEEEIPKGWFICNGENGTPDLVGRVIIGTGESYPNQGYGGSEQMDTNVGNTALSLAQLPTHRVIESVTSSTVRFFSPYDSPQHSFLKSGTAKNIGENEAHSHSINHSLMQPYATMLYIMKF